MKNYDENKKYFHHKKIMIFFNNKFLPSERYFKNVMFGTAKCHEIQFFSAISLNSVYFEPSVMIHHRNVSYSNYSNN